MSLEQGIATIKAVVQGLPLSPGVYRMLNTAGDVLYVGKAKQLKKRVSNYTQPARLPRRIQRMVAETVRMEIITTHTEVEALLLEANLIKQLKPRFNVLLRDDKMFPYLALSKDHEAPRLYKYRGSLNNKQADYYGPYANAGAVGRALLDLQKAFQLRTCSDNVYSNRTRPCLQYHIKRCSAPCVAYVSPAAYSQQVSEAKQFLSGRSRDLQERYATAMAEASKARDYEAAALYRDRIKTLNAVQTEQDINILQLGDVDIVGLAEAGGQVAVHISFFRQGRNFGGRAFFPQHEKEARLADVAPAFLMQFYLDNPIPPVVLLSESVPELDLIANGLSQHSGHKVHVGVPARGDKKRLVEHAKKSAAQALAQRLAQQGTQAELLQLFAERFQLAAPPARLEIYDNSHIQGKFALGAMVVAGAEGFKKSAYRTFNMPAGDSGGDDFAMMRAMLARRFAKQKIPPNAEHAASKNDWPDALIIDGGLGQLNAAHEMLAQLGIIDLPVIAIAKGPDRNAGQEDFYIKDQAPFKLPPNDPLLYFLQRLRDEAHRFAIGAHRKKRTKAIGETTLDAIGGIGPKRKKALLQHFGSGKAVAGAGISDLAKVPGISYELAQQIYLFYHPEYHVESPPVRTRP